MCGGCAALEHAAVICCTYMTDGRGGETNDDVLCGREVVVVKSKCNQFRCGFWCSLRLLSAVSSIVATVGDDERRMSSIRCFFCVGCCTALRVYVCTSITVLSISVDV